MGKGEDEGDAVSHLKVTPVIKVWLKGCDSMETREGLRTRGKSR